jgi:hypothetical protein
LWKKMNKLLLPFAILLIVILFLVPSAARAQSGDEAVVRAVLFYSPTCPHCHNVINEVLMPMVETYGDRLQIVGIDTTQPGGSQLYRSTVEAFEISDERLGVPTLVIGEVVLVGGYEIPNRFPGLVEEGLKAGGVDWPNIPGLAELMAQAEQAPTPSVTSPAPASPESTAAVQPTATLSPTAMDHESATAQPDPGETRCRVGQEDCAEPGAAVTAQSSTPEILGPTYNPTKTSEPSADQTDLAREGLVRLVFFWSDT